MPSCKELEVMHKIYYLMFFALVYGIPSIFSSAIAAESLDKAECKIISIASVDDLPTIHWHEGKTLKGVSIDVITQALKNIGIPYVIKEQTPYNRALLLAQRGEIDLLLPIQDDIEKARDFISINPPAFNLELAIFYKKESPIDHHDITDLENYSGAILQNVVLDEYFLNITNISSPKRKVATRNQAFKMLEAEHIDYFVSFYEPTVEYMVSKNIWKKYVAEPLKLSSSALHYAMSKSSTCTSKIKQISRELYQIINSRDFYFMQEKSEADWHIYEQVNNETAK
jgi:polar amino acid transport system substrate-binding protein